MQAYRIFFVIWSFIWENSELNLKIYQHFEEHRNISGGHLKIDAEKKLAEMHQWALRACREGQKDSEWLVQAEKWMLSAYRNWKTILKLFEPTHDFLIYTCKWLRARPQEPLHHLLQHQMMQIHVKNDRKEWSHIVEMRSMIVSKCGKAWPPNLHIGTDRVDAWPGVAGHGVADRPSD